MSVNRVELRHACHNSLWPTSYPRRRQSNDQFNMEGNGEGSSSVGRGRLYATAVSLCPPHFCQSSLLRLTQIWSGELTCKDKERHQSAGRKPHCNFFA